MKTEYAERLVSKIYSAAYEKVRIKLMQALGWKKTIQSLDDVYDVIRNRSRQEIESILKNAWQETHNQLKYGNFIHGCNANIIVKVLDQWKDYIKNIVLINFWKGACDDCLEYINDWIGQLQVQDFSKLIKKISKSIKNYQVKYIDSNLLY